MLSPLFSESSASGPQFTEDQARVFKRISSLAHIYFDQHAWGCRVEPRLWPLLVGSTGCGKTHLCRLLAGRTYSHYLRLCYGDWLVQGARSWPTMFSILDAATRYPRVVLHLDELDKTPVRAEQEWSRAVTNEIWSVLDGDLPFDRFLQDADVRGRHDADALLKLADGRARGRLFIVGSGTWQEILDARGTTKGRLGFALTESRSSGPDRALEETLSVRGPMAELLARFDGAVQVIRPPSLAEALVILDRSGARDYARHIHFDEVQVLRDLLPRQGFRALQSVVTELLVRGWSPRVSQKPELLADGCHVTPGMQAEFPF